MSAAMFENLSSAVSTIDRSCVIGYSEIEISKIEKLYDIRINGEFRRFMLEMGRCSGIFGDDPIILYRGLWSVRSQILFQCGFYENLAEAGLYEYVPAKPFAFSRESETQYYFLLTDSERPNDVFHFDENTQKIRLTEFGFVEYMLDVLRRYPDAGHKVLCKGELIAL